MSISPAEPPPLEANELEFAIALARGVSIAQAAQTANVSEATGYRWAKKAEIVRYVEEVRATVLQSAASKICDLTGRAVDTLRTLLDSSDPRVQLAAARQVLDGASKLRQLADMEQELTDIQASLLILQAQAKRVRT
jgi:hypothetical protein